MSASAPAPHVIVHRTGRPVLESVVTLGLDADCVVVVVGATRELSELERGEVERAVRSSLVPVLDERRALLIDGGTDSGVFQIVGQTVAAGSPATTLLGVAPSGRIYFPGETSIPGGFPAEPNHSCFLLAESDRWGGETALLVELVDILAETRAVAVLAIGGGTGTAHELGELTSRGHPAVVVRLTGSPPTTLPERGRASSAGRVSLMPSPLEGADLRRALRWRLTDDDVLRQAWQRFLAFEKQATTSRNRVGSLPKWILVLGVLTMIAAVVALADGAAGRFGLFALSILPAVALALLAWTVMARRDEHWIAPRAAAEQVLTNIHRYRARAGDYAEPANADAAATLAARLAEVEGLVEQEGLAVPEVVPPDWAQLASAATVSRSNEMFGTMTGEEYVESRVRHQYAYHTGRVVKQGRLARGWTGCLLGVGVAGVVSGALAGVISDDLRIVAVGCVILALYGAVLIATWIEYHQWDALIKQSEYLRAFLGREQEKWDRCSPDQRADPATCRCFVERTEDEFERENFEWRRRMRQAGGAFVGRASAPFGA